MQAVVQQCRVGWVDAVLSWLGCVVCLLSVCLYVCVCTTTCVYVLGGVDVSCDSGGGNACSGTPHVVVLALHAGVLLIDCVRQLPTFLFRSLSRLSHIHLRHTFSRGFLRSLKWSTDSGRRVDMQR